MKTMTLVALAASLMLAAPSGVNAAICHVPLTDLLDLDIAGTIYIDDRPGDNIPVSLVGFTGGTGTWVYLETNNVPGLQAGGASLIEEVDGDFPGCTNADLLIF